MRKILSILALTLASAGPARAEGETPAFAIGYSLATYLEGGGGIAPFGVFISGSTAARGRGVEADLAYHRDDGVNTVTAAIGPRMAWGGSMSSPYLHMMLLLRHDTVLQTSNSSGGAMMGVGVDAGRGGVRVRLGTDLQLLFDSGSSLKVLRMTLGAAF